MKKRYDRCILATACIPWKVNYQLDELAFEQEINHLINHNITHIYLFGTAGEGYSINNKQFETIVKIFAKLMNKTNLFPMVGIIELSPDRVNEKIDIAYSYGIRDFQFSLPSWHQLTYDEIVEFMNQILPKYPDCKFINYNTLRTKRFIEPEELFNLAKLYENFVGVKYTRGTKEDFKTIANEDTPLQFFLTEQNFAKLSQMTNCSLLISIGNLDLNLTNKFYLNCVSNNHNNIKEYMDKINIIHDAMFKIVNTKVIDGAYDKLYVKYNLPNFPIRLLKPYKYVSDDQFNEFKKIVKATL